MQYHEKYARSDDCNFWRLSYRVTCGPTGGDFIPAAAPVRCLASSSAAGVAASAAGGCTWELHIWKPSSLTRVAALLPPTPANAVTALGFSSAARGSSASYAARSARALEAHRSNAQPELLCSFSYAPSLAIVLLIHRRAAAADGGAALLHLLGGLAARAGRAARRRRGSRAQTTCAIEVPTPPVAGAADGGRGGGGVLVLSAHGTGDLLAWRLWSTTSDRRSQRRGKGPSLSMVRSASGAHRGAAKALCSCGMDGELVASGGMDGLVRLWTAYLDHSPPSTSRTAGRRSLLGRAASAGVPTASDAGSAPPVLGLCGAGPSVAGGQSLLVSTGDCR